MLLVKLVMLHARHLTNSVSYVPHCFKDMGHVNVIKLNTFMKQFRATVRASGMVVTTIVFAENTNFAIKILQAQFGANNVISIPTQI